ncbi:hypothetical protein MXB_1629, partial [Myxobolus squamalis]
LACYDYTGFNCQYDYIKNGKLHTDFNTGEQQDDSKCEAGELECLNGGTCLKSIVSFDTYCVCAKGYTGLKCEYEECVFNDEEFMYGNLFNWNSADRSQFCPATECDDEEFCQNGGKCKMYGTYKYCTCDNTTYAGRNCQHQCDPPCKISHCTFDNEGPYCYLSNEYEDQVKKSQKSPLTCN